MSLNIQPSGEKSRQLLNFNMENISHELSALLIGGELDGFCSSGSAPANVNTSEAAANAACVDQLNTDILCNDVSNEYKRTSTTSDTKEAQILELYLQCHYQQQLHQQSRHLQQQPCTILQQPNHNTLSPLYEVGQSTSLFGESAFTYSFCANINTNYTSVGNQIKPMHSDIQPSASAIIGSVSQKLPSSPKFEFHFLRSHSSNKHSYDANSTPLISSASRTESETEFFNAIGRRNSGGFGGNNSSCPGQRKFMKQQTDGTNIEQIDYDQIVVDMSLLALSLDNKELNPVLRLFGLFRKIHYYLNDILPFAVEHISLTPTKCSMPCTMNVQYQVKQVARKCTIFSSEMQRRLNANKIYSLELYLECEQSLNILRKCLTQVETFRRIEMEHKRGQFATEEAQVQSQKLEQLLEQLSDQIRITHIYVHAFNWAVERTNQSTVYSKMKEQQTGTANDYGWVANVATAKPTKSINCDITPNKINIDASNDIGVSMELSSPTGKYDRGVAVFTANCSEFDIERQSTRYIGYK